MAIIDSIKDKLGNIIYPKTLTKAVYEEGTNKKLDEILSLKTDKDYVDGLFGSGGQGSGDMEKSVYDTNNNGKVDSAEYADEAGLLDGKNASDFADAVHNHTIANVTGLQTALDAKPDTDTVYTHPSTHPYSMITGTPSSLPANGGNADTAKCLVGSDTRSVNSPPSEYMSSGSLYVDKAGWRTEFKNIATIGNGSFLTGTYCFLETKNPWSDGSGGYPIQIAYGAGRPCWRVGTGISTWGAWQGLSDGGNADTVDGQHASAFATSAQGTLATNALARSGDTMTGILYPQQNTSYTTGQARRIILSTGNPSGGGNGDIWIKYT